MIEKVIAGVADHPGPFNAARRAMVWAMYLLDVTPSSVTRLAEPTVTYLTAAEKIDMRAPMHVGEKVLQYGARNMLATVPEDMAVEMAAIAYSGSACKADPIIHMVSSLKDGERFSDIDALIDLKLKCLSDYSNNRGGPRDASKLLLVWAVHGNTRNEHLHVAMCRIDPATGRPVRLGSGWLYDSLQQFCALAAERFGFQPEANQDYEVVDGILVRRSDGKRAAGPGEMIPFRKGERAIVSAKAAEAPEFSTVKAAIDRAGSWPDLHLRLFLHGAVFSKAGSGARISLQNGEEIKASTLGKNYSMAQLVERLGAFQPGWPSPSKEQYDAYCRNCTDTRSRMEGLAKRFGWSRNAAAGYQTALSAMSDHPTKPFIWGQRGKPKGADVEEPRLLYWQPGEAGQGHPVPSKTGNLAGGQTTPSLRPTLTTLSARDEASQVLMRLLKRGGTVEPFGPPEFVQDIQTMARTQGLLVEDGRYAMPSPKPAPTPLPATAPRPVALPVQPIKPAAAPAQSKLPPGGFLEPLKFEKPLTAAKDSGDAPEASTRDQKANLATVEENGAPHGQAKADGAEMGKSSRPSDDSPHSGLEPAPKSERDASTSAPPAAGKTIATPGTSAGRKDGPASRFKQHPSQAPEKPKIGTDRQPANTAFQKPAPSRPPAGSAQAEAKADGALALKAQAPVSAAHTPKVPATPASPKSHPKDPVAAATPSDKPKSTSATATARPSPTPEMPVQPAEDSMAKATLRPALAAAAERELAEGQATTPKPEVQPDEARKDPADDLQIRQKRDEEARIAALADLLSKLKQQGKLMDRDARTGAYLPPQEAIDLWQAIPDSDRQRVGADRWDTQQKEVDALFQRLREPDCIKRRDLLDFGMFNLDEVPEECRAAISRYEAGQQFRVALDLFMEDRRAAMAAQQAMLQAGALRSR